MFRHSKRYLYVKCICWQPLIIEGEMLPDLIGRASLHMQRWCVFWQDLLVDVTSIDHNKVTSIYIYYIITFVLLFLFLIIINVFIVATMIYTWWWWWWWEHFIQWACIHLRVVEDRNLHSNVRILDIITNGARTTCCGRRRRRYVLIVTNQSTNSSSSCCSCYVRRGSG